MEKKLKVFLDSNVLFSAAYSGSGKSKSFLLYELQELSVIKVFISELVCDEAVINIKSKKFEQLSFLNYLINRSTVLHNTIRELKNDLIALLPLNDRIILSTAISYGMDYFLTGNTKDFKHLYFMKIDKTLILKPADFIYLRFR